MTPYYADEWVTLYHGDCRDVMPYLDGPLDLVVTDPPYGETSLGWDRWPDGWVYTIPNAVRSMWCFGSLRMFLHRHQEFMCWRLSQDVIWEKHNGSGFAADRFKRVHEIATHWYRGDWSTIYRDVPRVPGQARPSATSRRRQQPAHTGTIGSAVYEYGDTRMARSVIRVRSMNGLARHPTEKPVGILDPLIRYGCPEGGTVLDPFAGSGSTGEAARLSGRKAVLIEADERYCEVIAQRMSQGVLVPAGSTPDTGDSDGD